MELVQIFEAARPRLLALAFRVVGSYHDAEDAVQAAWARTQAADSGPENPEAWFTTVTSRACLDILRARGRRGELPLLTVDGPGEGLVDRVGADEAFLRREDVSRALLVLLNELSPRQRVAYVLHDLFAVPFEEVAAVLDTNPAAAKKLASRARGRVSGAEVPAAAAWTPVVEAFLAAARGGDLDRLVALLAPDAVRIADARLLPGGAPTVVRGAGAIARETRAFAERIAVTVPMVVDGMPGAVIAPGGWVGALIRFRIAGGVVVGFEIGLREAGTVLAAAAGVVVARR